MPGETGQTKSRMLNRLQYDAANKASNSTAPSTADVVLTFDVSTKSSGYTPKLTTREQLTRNNEGPFAVGTNAAASPSTASIIPGAAWKTGRGATITSTGANAVAYLPLSSNVPIGAPCLITIGATGCELRGLSTAIGGSTKTVINGTNASTGKEMAIAANSAVLIWKRATDQYVAFHITSVGAMASTEATSPVPD